MCLTVIQSLIALVNDPQPEHPLRADLAEEYSKDRKKFLKNAEEFTKKHGEKRPMDWSLNKLIALSLSLSPPLLLSHIPDQIQNFLLPPPPTHTHTSSLQPRSHQAEARQKAQAALVSLPFQDSLWIRQLPPSSLPFYPQPWFPWPFLTFYSFLNVKNGKGNTMENTWIVWWKQSNANLIFCFSST